jgi:hypothetical protein
MVTASLRSEGSHALKGISSRGARRARHVEDITGKASNDQGPAGEHGHGDLGTWVSFREPAGGDFPGAGGIGAAARRDDRWRPAYDLVPSPQGIEVASFRIHPVFPEQWMTGSHVSRFPQVIERDGSHGYQCGNVVH